MKKSILIGLTLAVSLFGNFAIASSVKSCDGRTGIDFSDAGTNSNGEDYDIACHQTDRWQRLGGVEGEDRYGDSSYSTGSSPSWDGESGASTNQDDNDLAGGGSTDDGVLWSTDGGNTWTNTGEITRGEEVIFQFAVSRSIDGNHNFDELKAWVDWNQDGDWDNDANNDEIIEHTQWYKYKNAADVSISGLVSDKDWDDLSDAEKITACDAIGLNVKIRNGQIKRCKTGDDNKKRPSLSATQQCATNGLTYNNASGRCNSDDDYRVYQVAMEVPLDAVLGDTWLRARVVCSNSLSKYSDSMNMTAYGYQDQGEVEDFALKIVDKKPPTEVSEPAGILVMSSALMFIAAARRRRSKV